MTAPGTPTRRQRREEQDQAKSRRRTVLVIVAIVVVIAAAVAIWYFAIRDDSTTDASATTTSSSSTIVSSSSTSSTSTTTSGSSTASTAPLPPPTDPEGYTKTLFSAWAAGDRTKAATVANQAAITSLFATPSSDAPNWTFSGCQGAAGSIFCTWTRAGGQLAMQVNDGTGGTPILVEEVTIGPG